MKIVMWSDVHVEHSVAQDNLRGVRQSVLVLDVLDHIIESIQPLPDAILVNGDFFDAFGKIDSALAVLVVGRIERLAALGIKFIFITGNHEYSDVEPEFFGKGILTALFANKEERGIFVIDRYARYIRLDEHHVVLGLPYRETYEQFEESCLLPMREGEQKGLFLPGKDRLIVGWHVGLPFATAWRGNEDENAWITADHPVVQELCARAYGSRLYLGHYHGPGDCEFITKDGQHIGTGTYIGSPATRSRAESGQDKRIAIWDNGEVSFISTGLNLDAVVHSVEEATTHLAQMVAQYGEEILDIASVHINLGDDASMDDFHVAKSKVAQFPGDISVDRPNVKERGPIDQVFEKHREDPNSTREKLELDIFYFSVRRHYQNTSFKGLPEEALDAMEAVGSRTWKRLFRSLRKGAADEEARVTIEAALSAAGLSKEAQPQLTEDFCSQAGSLARTKEKAKQYALMVS